MNKKQEQNQHYILYLSQQRQISTFSLPTSLLAKPHLEKMCTYTWLYFLCFHSSPEPHFRRCKAVVNGERCPSLPKYEYFQTFTNCVHCIEEEMEKRDKAQEERVERARQRRQARDLRRSHAQMLPHLEVQSRLVIGSRSYLRRFFSLLKLSWNIGSHTVAGKE